MYKKVKVLLPELRLEETGERIGVIPIENQPIDVVLDNGVKTAAYYGTSDEKGNYYTFCKTPCPEDCPKRGKTYCRNNPESRARAGYYVNINSKNTG